LRAGGAAVGRVSEVAVEEGITRAVRAFVDMVEGVLLAGERE
jgi:hypothetical protein